MRKGRGAGESKNGGAWASSAITREDGAQVAHWRNACTVPSAIGEDDMPCTEDGWPRTG